MVTKLRQSVAWWCYADRGVDDAALLRGIAGVGFEAVELIGEEKFPLVHDAGLRIAAHGGHSSIEHGLNDPREHDRIEREIRHSLELAQVHRIPNLIVFSGGRRAGVSEDEGIGHTAAGLRRVARAAEDAGVTLALELLNSRVDHPGYECDHTEWGVRVCERVGSPRVKLLYDIYHMQIMEGDLVRTIGAHHGYLCHYHTAGNPGRRDLDGTQEIAYPAVFGVIRAMGYDGYIGHEFIPKGDPVAALRAAYDLCDSEHERNPPP